LSVNASVGTSLTGRRIAPPKPRGDRRGREPRRIGYLWILPGILFSVGVIYYAVGDTAWISTLSWDGVSPDPQSVGLNNYVQLAGDAVFWSALLHTVIFCITIIVQLVLGFLFAAVLHSRIKLAGVYKVVLFVPVVIAPAIMAPVFRQVFSPGGIVDASLGAIGLSSWEQPWLAQPSTALIVVMIISVWQWTGFSFLLYYAAMTQVDPSMLEAARLDGAGVARTLWSVVFPNVRGTTASLILLGIIGSLKTFDIPFLVTGGGPNHSSEFLATYIYQQTISESHAGYGSAIAMVLLALSVVLAIVQNRGGRAVNV
jgi:raffinose/stachyose/melibiose transport system permease protein